MGNCLSTKQTDPIVQTQNVETTQYAPAPAVSPGSPPPISPQSHKDASEQTPNIETFNNSSSLAPSPAPPLPISLPSLAGPSNTPYTVFISHAGEDKVTIAIPLRDRLKKRGIAAFVDMEDMRAGTEAEQAMIHAMETARIGVFVMSPEFVARKWPMKELMCFLKRREESKATGDEGPTIIPFFFRLSVAEVYDEPRLDRNDKFGNKLYEKSRYFERQRKGEPEANIAAIKAALRSLHGTMGLENFVKANNDTSYEMDFNRRIMLEELVKKICEASPGSTFEKSVTEQTRDVNQDSFRPHFDVAYDASELVFDFERKDRNGEASMQEGKILEMLLDRSIDKNRAIAVRGIGGVGKTSLLRKIRSLKKVSNRFADGVYCLEVGKDATYVGLQDMLISLVRRSGGNKTASNMRTESDMRKVIEAFRSWFAQKQCLFVIDDIWETKEITRGVTRDLWTLHTSGRDSKTLLTTRSNVIAADGSSYASLEPRLPLEAESRAILYHYAGLKPEEGEGEETRAVDEILRRCAGLPLFLGVAGKGVKTLSFRAGHSGCMAYRFYADHLNTSMVEMMNTGIGSHAGLSAGLKTSIELVEERKERFEFDVPASLGEMHRRLSVMKKQMRVPMRMLQQLWKLENESEAARIAREFEQVGLVDVEYEKKECGFMEVLRFHNSVYEFAVYETQRYKEGGLGHETLLEGYGRRLKRNDGFKVLRQWWSEDLEDDGYVHKNLCRHLMGAMLEEELFGLLLSPEWFERQLELNGAVLTKSDMSVGLEAVRKKIERCRDEGNSQIEEALELIREALELIREAISLSTWKIIENDAEKWFQVHGRLQRAGGYNKLVREYVRRIERKTPKPGVLCMNGFLMEAGGPNMGIIHVGSQVWCMILLMDGERVACGCLGGNIVIVNARLCEIEMQWRSHDDVVTAIDVGEDGTRIMSGSRDKTAKIWDIQSGRCLALFEGHSDALICVSMTQDGKRAVCGCADGSFQVWDIESSSKVGGSIKLDGMKCLTVFKDGEHVVMGGDDGELEIWNVTTNTKVGTFLDAGMDRVSCATLTWDESRLVSGSWDGTVRLWDVETRHQIESLFDGHSKWIKCVASSADGGRIVSGSCDGNIRVWDVKSREQIADPLICHTTWVTGVSILAQRDTIVSCSDDMTVRVWNLKRKSSSDNKHGDRVWDVSFSPSGRYVVSGSGDGTIRIWNPISGQTVGEPLRQKNCDSRIFGVAVTPNDQFALSGSDDGRVRVWDLQTRSVKCSFRGHTKAIWCIAVTPGGEWAVTGSWDRSIRVWDLNSMDGSHVVLGGHSSGVRSVFVSDDGKRIISVARPDEIFVWDIEAKKETRRIMKEVVRLTSRRQVLCAVGESTVSDEAALSVRRYGTQIIHDEESEAVVLGTLDSIVNDWDISPDNKTMCVGLEDGHVGFLKLVL